MLTKTYAIMLKGVQNSGQIYLFLTPIYQQKEAV
jgi:hypothetical protein